MTVLGTSHRLARESALVADDVSVALAPAQAYARLVERVHTDAWWRVLQRPLLALLVIGAASTIAATGRVTLSGVASGMLLWSWVILVQLAAGALVIATAPRRQVSAPAAMDLLFAGHIPWSAWVVVIAAWHAADAPYGIVVAAAGGLAALVANISILNAFNRTVLRTTDRGARVRTAAHQALIWLVALWFAASTSGGWYRLVNP